MRNKSNLLVFLVVEWWWLVGMAWISSGGVDRAIMAAVIGDVQGGGGRRQPRLVVVVWKIKIKIKKAINN